MAGKPAAFAHAIKRPGARERGRAVFQPVFAINRAGVVR